MGTSVGDAIREIDELHEAGRHEEARSALDRLEAMDMDGAGDYMARGRFLVRAHRYGAAVVDFEAATARDVDDPESYFWLGGVRSTLGRQRGAIDALRRAVRLRPDSQEAAYALSWELERLGRYGEALEELRRYKNADPGHSRHIYLIWGRIRGRQGKWRRAYTSYVKAIRPERPDRDAPGDAEQERMRVTAIRRRAATMDPAKLDSFRWLGASLQDAGWDEDAAAVLGTAALMRPDVDLYLTIGSILERHKLPAEAIENYKDGIRQMSGTAQPAALFQMYDALIAALLRSNRFQEALDYGAKAISLGSTNMVIQNHYDFAREMIGKMPQIDPVAAGLTEPYYLGRRLTPSG